MANKILLKNARNNPGCSAGDTQAAELAAPRMSGTFGTLVNLWEVT